MGAADFVRLFAYDHWASQECLKALHGGPAAAIGRIAHVLAAEKLWLERIQETPQSMPVWPALTLAQCDALADEIAREWGDFLANLPPDGLSKTIEYRNSKGEPWRSRVEDVLMHVILHSAYHRGQIALEMRAAGMEPAYTDFIHAVRQEFLE